MNTDFLVQILEKTVSSGNYTVENKRDHIPFGSTSFYRHKRRLLSLIYSDIRSCSNNWFVISDKDELKTALQYLEHGLLQNPVTEYSDYYILIFAIKFIQY